MISLYFFIPGVVCLFLGCIFLFLFQRSRIRHEAMDRSITAQAWGKLVHTGSRTEGDYDNRTHTVYYGTYEFDTADGQHISASSDFGYRQCEAVPGTRGNMVKLQYNPSNPSEFFLCEEHAISKTIWPTLKKTGILLTALGILLTAASIAALFGLFDPLLDSLLG